MCFINDKSSPLGLRIELSSPYSGLYRLNKEFQNSVGVVTEKTDILLICGVVFNFLKNIRFPISIPLVSLF